MWSQLGANWPPKDVRPDFGLQVHSMAPTCDRVDLGPTLVQYDELGPAWAQVGQHSGAWPNLAPSWVPLGAARAQVGPNTGQECRFNAHAGNARVYRYLQRFLIPLGGVPHVRPVLAPIRMANSFTQDHCAC